MSSPISKFIFGRLTSRKKDLETLFDSHWYVENYFDISSTPSNPLRHYLEIGWKLGFDPCPFFDSDWYLHNYQTNNVCPLIHFIDGGWKSGNRPNPIFDPLVYIEINADVASSGINPLVHYLKFGFVENRRISHFPLPDSVFPMGASSLLRKFNNRNVDAKRVAVLIPVYNNWHLTERCLQSLFRSEANQIADIVILDDGSTDQTLDTLKRYQGVRAISTPSNMGFTLACNFGFKKLEDYEYIYLLNNDTEVLPGFLQSAVDVIESKKCAALVGSTLLSDDLSIQECGGIIWNDASGYNFGRGLPYDKPELSFTRKVDYVSGAGILIRNAALQSVGYFDERFAPAYYEDTDLAFSFRDAGYSTWVSSTSRVIHFEGKSHGTDLTQGIKANQIANQDKFLLKWEEVLSRHPASTGEYNQVTKAAMRHHFPTGPAGVWVDDLAPTVKRDSGSVRTDLLLKTATEVSNSIVFVASFDSYGSNANERLRNLGQPTGPSVQSSVEFLENLGLKAQFVWISRISSAIKVLSEVIAWASDAKIIFDTVDLHYLRTSREAEIHQKPELFIQSNKLKMQEEKMMDISDLTLVVSEYEKHLYRESPVFEKIKVLANIHEVSSNLPKFEITRGLFFIGGFGHLPNVSGITWFVKEVWPLLPQTVRSDGLTIAGSSMPTEIWELASDEVHPIGWVQDSLDVLQRHRVSIAPLLAGAGVKGKVGEAMAGGIPVVGTSIALEGMGVISNVNAIIANGPEDFANAITNVYSNSQLWERIQAGASALIYDNYSIDATRKRLDDILSSLQLS